MLTLPNTFSAHQQGFNIKTMVKTEKASRHRLYLRKSSCRKPKDNRAGGNIQQGNWRKLKLLAPTAMENTKHNPTPGHINRKPHPKSPITSVPIISE